MHPARRLCAAGRSLRPELQWSSGRSKVGWVAASQRAAVLPPSPPPRVCRRSHRPPLLHVPVQAPASGGARRRAAGGMGKGGAGDSSTWKDWKYKVVRSHRRKVRARGLGGATRGGVSVSGTGRCAPCSRAAIVPTPNPLPAMCATIQLLPFGNRSSRWDGTLRASGWPAGRWTRRFASHELTTTAGCALVDDDALCTASMLGGSSS